MPRPDKVHFTKSKPNQHTHRGITSHTTAPMEDRITLTRSMLSMSTQPIRPGLMSLCSPASGTASKHHNGKDM